MARFDWMAATIPEQYPSVIVDALMALPDAHDIERGRGRQNYRETVTIRSRDGDPVATLLHGGHNPAPHALASGEPAEPFTALLRAEWPAHRVTRLDSAQDVRGDFGATVEALQGWASRKRLKGLLLTPDDPEEGGTYYIGAPTSAFRFRLYEKSKELAKKLGSADGIEPDVLRFELQARPAREPAKLVAAQLSPEEAWGVTPWAREIARTHLDGNPDRVVMQRRPPTSYERTHRAMLDMFGSHLRQMLQRHGGEWWSVGEQLGLDLDAAPFPDR